jgi:hypothetical protein
MAGRESGFSDQQRGKEDHQLEIPDLPRQLKASISRFEVLFWRVRSGIRLSRCATSKQDLQARNWD